MKDVVIYVIVIFFIFFLFAILSSAPATVDYIVYFVLVPWLVLQGVGVFLTYLVDQGLISLAEAFGVHGARPVRKWWRTMLFNMLGSLPMFTWVELIIYIGYSSWVAHEYNLFGLNLILFGLLTFPVGFLLLVFWAFALIAALPEPEDAEKQ